MSKKNTALILGLAALGAVLYFRKPSAQAAGDGGNLLPPGDNSEYSGAVPRGGGSDVISEVKSALSNPWNTALSIANYAGFEGAPTDEKMAAAGYTMGSYESYLRQYPASRMSAEEYYSLAGAYELAALTNPDYAFGAQQSQIALGQGKITPREFQTLKKQGFVNEAGQAVQPAGGKTTYTYGSGGTATTTPTGGIVLGGGWTRSGW